MCEFWLYGFNTAYSVIEAACVAHTCGRPVVGAESFTSGDDERWQALSGLDEGARATGRSPRASTASSSTATSTRPGSTAGPA